MSVALGEPVPALSVCLERVRGTLGGLDDTGITQTLREIEALSRRTHAVMLELVAEADARGIAAREGFGSTARLLAGMLQLSAGEARTRVEHAAMVSTRRMITGETLAPRLPATATALAAGEIGTGQLRVITETMAALPASVPEAARERAEADLAGYARDFDPRRLRTIAHRLLAHLDPEGPQPGDGPAPVTPARGELWLRDRRDGRLTLEGWLDPEHGSMVRALIEQLAAHRPTSDDGVPETRTVPARQADALIELCERARAAEEFPTTAGEPPHLTVTIDWDALRTALGAATLDYGQLISAADARRVACDCKLIPVVLGGDSEPLDVGRAMRTVPLSIRRALIARDGGCSFPGCDRPLRPQLLSLVPDAPPSSAPARLGHHHQRRTRRIPTSRHHQPRPPTPHQPTPPLTTTAHCAPTMRRHHEGLINPTGPASLAPSCARRRQPLRAVSATASRHQVPQDTKSLCCSSGVTVNVHCSAFGLPAWSHHRQAASTSSQRRRGPSWSTR